MRQESGLDQASEQRVGRCVSRLLSRRQLWLAIAWLAITGASAAQSGLEVLFSTEAARGVRTKAVKGRLVADEAVKQMLSGTPLYVVVDSKNRVLRIARTKHPNG